MEVRRQAKPSQRGIAAVLILGVRRACHVPRRKERIHRPISAERSMLDREPSTYSEERAETRVGRGEESAQGELRAWDAAPLPHATRLSRLPPAGFCAISVVTVSCGLTV